MDECDCGRTIDLRTHDDGLCCSCHNDDVWWRATETMRDVIRVVENRLYGTTLDRNPTVHWNPSWSFFECEECEWQTVDIVNFCG